MDKLSVAREMLERMCFADIISDEAIADAILSVGDEYFYDALKLVLETQQKYSTVMNYPHCEQRNNSFYTS